MHGYVFRNFPTFLNLWKRSALPENAFAACPRCPRGEALAAMLAQTGGWHLPIGPEFVIQRTKT